MKIAVTGGLGFIGSNFIRYILDKYPGDEVINIDKETYASNHNYLKNYEVDSRYKFHKADIAFTKQIEKPLNDVDAIVNFAAESHVDNSINNSDLFISSNFIGAVNLLNLSNERGIRFNQVSTDEVFGSLPIQSEVKFNEDTRYNPRNPYSASKAAADHMVLSYYNTYSSPVTITHSSNNYGPHQHREKFIPKIILNALNNHKIPVYGDGKQIRDWLFVQDNCRGIDLVLRKGTIGQRYLIGGSNEIRNEDLVMRILQLMGKNYDLIEHVKDRSGHDIRYSSEISKISKELGWAPSVPFELGLKITLEHYINNMATYL